MTFKATKDFSKELDNTDPLKIYREMFHLPLQGNGKEYIYFCGNSLGLQPKTTSQYVEQELHDWEKLGVLGHLEAKNPWLPYHEFLTDQMAEVVGSEGNEVVVMNTLTVNLHLMMVSFYRPTTARNKILVEHSAFPSDQYAVKSQIKFHGYDPHTSLIELSPRDGEAIIRTEDIEKTIDEYGDSIALILLGGINYYSGQAFDMKRITSAGHNKGCIVGFDLAHAAGNILLKLHDWEVDFAVWCTYKYLNSGPGGLAGCFINEKFADSSKLPRFAGWWGHDKDNRFKMEPDFKPIPGAEGWQLSNPPIFPMAALRASLEIFSEAGMINLRKKSVRLTSYLKFLIEELSNNNIEIITPENEDERGCQLSIRVKNNDKSIYEFLSVNGVIADWREPDVIRVAPVPLYNTFEEVFSFYEILQKALSK